MRASRSGEVRAMSMPMREEPGYLGVLQTGLLSTPTELTDGAESINYKTSMTDQVTKSMDADRSVKLVKLLVFFYRKVTLDV